MSILLAWLVAAAGAAQATIPESARTDPRFGLGYLVVTHYPGVTSDGTGDSTVGIQQAIDDAREAKRALLFPPGTYVISDTLRCFRWRLWNPVSGKPCPTRFCAYETHVLVGSTLGTARPVIKLATIAPAFDDAETPRPMIAFRQLVATDAGGNAPVQPNLPFEAPPSFQDDTASLFGEELRGIDFDTGGHAGAAGVYFPAAQESSVEDVRVEATGSYAGFWGLPGRDMGGANIEVHGGRYGLLLRLPSSLPQTAMAGPMVVGARLINQTEEAVVFADFSPLAMVGFHIVKDSGPAIRVQSCAWSTAWCSMSLVDGIIEIGGGGGLAIDNAAGKSLYLRNVYVIGTDALVQSGTQPEVTSIGTWPKIREYAYTNQVVPADDSPYELGDGRFATHALVDGVLLDVPEPVVDVMPEAESPPGDLVERHLWQRLPSYEGQADGTVVITAPPFLATPDDDTDDTAAIQAAIDTASAQSDGRVFVPAGVYRISRSLTLHANSIFFGAARRIAEITYHDSWQPTDGHAVLLRTDDDDQATTFLGFLTLRVRNTGGELGTNGASVYDRFDHIEWRAGRSSMIAAMQFEGEYLPPDMPTNPRVAIRFAGHGGGRHFFLTPDMFGSNEASRQLLVEDTSEPLAFYGLNVEGGKGSIAIASNIEILRSENVRIYSVKREGTAPSLVVRDSHNVALYSSGAMRNPTFAGSGGYLQLLGNSDALLVANASTQLLQELPNGEAMLHEALAGRSSIEVAWPEGVSLYKRGSLDDSAMTFTRTPRPLSAHPQSDGCACGAAGNELGWIVLLLILIVGRRGHD